MSILSVNELKEINSSINLLRVEAIVKLKPSDRNTFSLRKTPKNKEALLGGKAESYYAMDKIETEGEFRVLYYSTTHNQKFQANMLARAIQLYVQNVDDDEDFMTLRGVAFDAIKCPQCHGRGYFITRNKVSLAQAKKEEMLNSPDVIIDPTLLAGAFGRKNAVSRTGSVICTWNPHINPPMGCNGKAINMFAWENYAKDFENIKSIKSPCEKLWKEKQDKAKSKKEA